MFCLQSYKIFFNRPTPSCNTNYCVCNIPLYNKKSLTVFPPKTLLFHYFYI